MVRENPCPAPAFSFLPAVRRRISPYVPPSRRRRTLQWGDSSVARATATTKSTAAAAATTSTAAAITAITDGGGWRSGLPNVASCHSPAPPRGCRNCSAITAAVVMTVAEKNCRNPPRAARERRRWSFRRKIECGRVSPPSSLWRSDPALDSKICRRCRKAGGEGWGRWERWGSRTGWRQVIGRYVGGGINATVIKVLLCLRLLVIYSTGL